PNRLVVKTVAAFRLAQLRDRLSVGHAGRVLVADEFHIAAERNGRELPAGAVAIGEAQKLAPEPDRKNLHPNAAPPRHEKMAEFVKENHDGQNEQKRHDQVISGCPAAPAANTREKLHSILVPGPWPSLPTNPYIAFAAILGKRFRARDIAILSIACAF